MQIRCRTCGAMLTAPEKGEYLVCEYCGAPFLIRSIDDKIIEQKLETADNLYRINDFDGAYDLYQEVLALRPEDGDIYWRLVLCTYGVEFVQDTGSSKHIPVCHKTVDEPILTCSDYINAVELADDDTAQYYNSCAHKIDAIQKNIFKIASETSPFDIFISYKQTDDVTGRNTKESETARMLYYELSSVGYKVFYAPETLQSIAGNEYEPYIYAALSTAKLMIVIGFTAEHFNAVWVKNEWSRYAKRKYSNPRINMLVCYNSLLFRGSECKDVVPAELFVPSQLRDMSRVSPKDIVNEVKLLIQLDAKANNINNDSAGTSKVITSSEQYISSWIRRAYKYIEVEEWAEAEKQCKKVLDFDSKCAEAYIILTMINNKFTRADMLNKYDGDLNDDENFAKALSCAEDDYKRKLTEYRLTALSGHIESLISAAVEDDDIDAIAKVQILCKDNASYDVINQLGEKCLSASKSICSGHAEKAASAEREYAQSCIDNNSQIILEEEETLNKLSERRMSIDSERKKKTSAYEASKKKYSEEADKCKRFLDRAASDTAKHSFKMIFFWCGQFLSIPAMIGLLFLYYAIQNMNGSVDIDVGMVSTFVIIGVVLLFVFKHFKSKESLNFVPKYVREDRYNSALTAIESCENGYKESMERYDESEKQVQQEVAESKKRIVECVNSIKRYESVSNPDNESLVNCNYDIIWDNYYKCVLEAVEPDLENLNNLFAKKPKFCETVFDMAIERRKSV